MIKYLYMLLAALLVSSTKANDSGTKNPQTAQQKQMIALIKRLAPLPENTPRDIINPYHAKTAWKLWSVDPKPVNLNRKSFKASCQPPPEDKRMYAVISDSPQGYDLKPIGTSGAAGFWDDCYLSLDNFHTRLRYPANQFILAGKMPHSGDWQSRFDLGVNFTSQSYSDRGRAIVDDTINNLAVEKFFYFANTIRCTPSHASFEDSDEAMARDKYDGLYSHSYQSIGQSGSEMHALFKMMVAGSAMPRTTKDLLKTHGAYAPTLLTLFKAALPYSDSDGKPLPYEHELRHRVAYSSHGDPLFNNAHNHYKRANVLYHCYDDRMHLQTMITLASRMTSPPPVTLIHLVSLAIEKDGQTISDKRELVSHVKAQSLTNIRVWGKPGETITMRIDARRSYDLNKLPLTFKCLPLYPNQKNVTVAQLSPGVFDVTVKHDPKLPKGRIPIIITADNGKGITGNPAFLNVYWPDGLELADYPHFRISPQARKNLEKLGIKTRPFNPVNVNKRPVVTFDIVGNSVRCRPGDTVKVNIKAVDPEGFPVLIYRRPGEIGRLTGSVFTATIPADMTNGVETVNFHFSDGTGGTIGKQIKILVSRGVDKLPKGWNSIVIGNMNEFGTVSSDGGTITFNAFPATSQKTSKHRKQSQKNAFLVYTEATEPLDVICRIPQHCRDADLSLVFLTDLASFGRRGRIGYLRGQARTMLRPRPHPWGETHTTINDPHTYFRLVAFNKTSASYSSADGKNWTQLIDSKLDRVPRLYAGLAYSGRTQEGDAVAEWIKPKGLGLPLIAPHRPKKDKKGNYHPPLNLRLSTADKNAGIVYTLDGSEPTPKSSVFDKSLTLDSAGTITLKAKTIRNGKSSGTVTRIFKLVDAPTTTKKKTH